MSEVSVFNIGGTNIDVKDKTARSAAETAQTTASSALQKVQEIESLSRVTVAYDARTETVTITTSDHN